MKKNAKAAIAVAAGTLLLLGGGGSLAVWSQSQDLNAGSIVSGQLTLSAPTTGNWYEKADWDANGAAATALPANYKVVPEDDLVFVTTGAVLVTQGSNLYYTFGTTIDAAALSADGYTVSAPVITKTAGDALPTPVAAGTTVGTDKFTGVTAGTDVYKGTSTATSTTFQAVVEVSFDASGTDNQAETLDLSGAKLQVTQVVLAAS